MSHHGDQIITCPNCGSKATGNYCAQCGQENDLHEETTWQLFMHFFGHYFHYDSKFWNTLKVLWLHPGELTVAYWKKQRMRFIPPIPLYIFVSAVYFLIAFSLPNTVDNPGTLLSDTISDSTSAVSSAIHEPATSHAADNKAVKYFRSKAEKIAIAHHRQPGTYLSDKLWHSAPKLMFLMIPVLASLLKFRFRSRKDLRLVDHTIFAFHIHCFWFSIRLLSFIEINGAINLIMNIAFFSIFFGYMVQALKKAYSIPGTNATITLLGISVGYILALAVVTAIALLLYLLIA